MLNVVRRQCEFTIKCLHTFSREVTEQAGTIDQVLTREMSSSDLIRQPARLARALLDQLCDLVQVFFRLTSSRLHFLYRQVLNVLAV
jgi:hypothetical protein